MNRKGFKDLIIKEETIVMPIDPPMDIVVKKEAEESLKGENISDEKFMIKEETILEPELTNMSIEGSTDIFKMCIKRKRQEQGEIENNWNEFHDFIIKEETTVMAVGLPEDIKVEKEENENIDSSFSNFIGNNKPEIENVPIEESTDLDTFKMCAAEKRQEQEEIENNWNEFHDLIIKEETVVVSVGLPEDVKLEKEARKSLKGENVLTGGGEFPKKMNKETLNEREEGTTELREDEKNLGKFTRGGSLNSNLEMPHKCSECGKRFKSRRCLNRHQLIHSSERPYKCSECGKNFLHKGSWNKHRLTHSNEKPHECSECGKRFKSRQYLKHHQLIHSGKKPHKCSECGKNFLHKFHLNKHRVTHSNETPYECSECGKHFKNKQYLNQHQLTHSDEKPHKCSECGKNFRHKFTLNQHRLIHSNEKPHECSECGKRFKNKQCLYQHQFSHSDEKPHKCSECGKNFRHKSSWNKHRLTHSNEKPHECSECGNRFKNKECLNQHQVIHSDQKLHKCSDCGQCFRLIQHPPQYQLIQSDEKSHSVFLYEMVQEIKNSN